MYKRLMAFVISATLLVTIAACTPSSPAPAAGGESAAGGSAPTEGVVLSPDNPTTLSAWITTTQQAPAPDNKITKLLQEKLGVTIEYEIITPDNQEQKIGVSLAGGEYPDLIGSTDQSGRMVEGGSMIKLDDHLASGKYPNLAEHVEPYIARLSYTGGAVEDGLYIIPNYNRFYGDITGGTHYGTGFFIQKAVLVDAGYPDLSNMTLERYFELIANYMEKYPTIDGQPTIGFEVLAATGYEWGLTNPPVFLAGHPNNGGVIVDENNVATIYANKSTSHDYYKLMNEMNDRGLVDRESFTQTLDQYLAKIASGRVLGMHDQRWSFGTAHDALMAANMDERTYVATMPTWEGVEPYYADRDVMNINQGFGVSVSCKQVEAALSFLDVMLSEEWQKIISWGIEGEDYMVGDDGMFYRTQEQRDNYLDLTWRSNNRLEALRDIMPKHQGSFSDGNAYGPDEQASEFFDTLRDFDKNFLNAYNKKTWRDFVNKPPENPVYYPAWNIPLVDGSDAQMANKQMQDASLQYIPRAILASPDQFEDIWNEYMATLDKIDVKAYEDAINAGIQERIANWQ